MSARLGRADMEPFIRLAATAAPLKRDNIDTDQILPARFLMMPRDERYRTYVFRDLRQNADGSEIPDFVLNQKPFRDERIIVAGHNFGCGSSREGAVFTLVDAGFRCVIAPGFGDIFYNNAFNNGLLPVILPGETIEILQELLEHTPMPEITVDLEEQLVTGPEKFTARFEIDPHRREKLLKGLDPVAYTMQFEAAINEFENTYGASYPWG